MPENWLVSSLTSVVVKPGQDNAEFFVRGVTTFGTGKANPLILIDNVELTSSDLSRLNPDDIESFSVLKDATATASMVHGVRME